MDSVFLRSGNSVRIDTSEEKCSEFGFLAGQIVFDVRESFKEGVILGVGKPRPDFHEVLFWHLKGDYLEGGQAIATYIASHHHGCGAKNFLVSISDKSVRSIIVENSRGSFFEFLMNKKFEEKILYSDLLYYIYNSDLEAYPICSSKVHDCDEDSFDYKSELELIAINNDLELFDDYFVLKKSFDAEEYVSF